MSTMSEHPLSTSMRGAVLAPGDPEYDAARDVDNHCRAARPAVIAQCADAHDVSAAVRWAVAEGLPLAVRGGGHSAGGFGTVEDGLVVDLRALRAVRLDSSGETVSVGGGALAGDVDRVTHDAGRATTTPTVSTVGMGGFTLGGGISHLTRGCGLAIDNLVGAEVVLSDGSVVEAGPDDDLLWALRGGGGNVGVVTELRMRAVPLTTVVGGPMLFDLEDTEALVRCYRDWLPEQADDIYAYLAVLTTPPQGPFPDDVLARSVCALMWCNTGDEAGSEQALAEFRARGPIFDGVGRMPYPALQRAFDEGAALGRYGHLTGLLYEDLPDEAVEWFRRFGSEKPTPMCMSHLYPLDGAAARPAPGATAWPWRNAEFAQMFAALSPVAGVEESLAAWSQGFRDALRPYALPGGYANFMMDEGASAARACYGTNAARLARLKGEFDPGNVFRRNQNIGPDVGDTRQDGAGERHRPA